ncbi:GIY-YIG nuclease family protein [Marinomonas sp. 15G1-11]|uniref:GIY-YIG nuclease family protein n=1 Tax=Marinomonas phaeophyticola TaxID=3004091 RepID=A0ABT4JQM2_9GAMM|nr:GIY-YIG nuclease family protein [Marinomonas sp. 15G1-11]MCZ2720681.1 GIY-YIG nuclease family protein [Marinomonas sp. 15G1-11]
MSMSEKDCVIPTPVWSVYIIQTRLNTLYTGVTTDVDRRFKEHQGSARGAKYLKGKGPLVLIWQQVIGTKSDALKTEYYIKRLKRKEKSALISGHFYLDESLFK